MWGRQPPPPPADPAAQLAAAEAAVTENPLKEAYFGEEHLHTSYSLDAYIGGARLTPDDAYRFAEGQEVTIHGDKHSIGRPLDWAAVTDHAEYLGEMYSTQVKGAPGYDHPQLVELRGLTKMEDQEQWFLTYVQKPNRGTTPKHAPFYAGVETTKSGWQVEVAAATAHYKPGRFTTLVAFEWSGAPGGANLHRNVFFRDLRTPAAPTSYVESNREDKLWQWMAEAEKNGSTLFAIPHNSNASKGLMFGGLDGAGQPYSAEYAQLRNHMEPLIEIMQIKGNSEVQRKFWAADEFAGFENADSMAKYSGRVALKQNFVRWGVIKGLDYEAKLGTNPFQYGFVGGTDNHNGAMADVAEDNFIGSHGPADGTVSVRRTGEVGGWIMGKDLNPGAITGVWAPKNTRARHLRCDALARDFRHLGPAHQGAPVCRRRPARASGRCAHAGDRRLRPRRADGGDAQGAGKSRRPSPSTRRRTASARTSTASRSSRAGSMRRANRRSASSTWPGVASASPARMASCRRSAIPWT